MERLINKALELGALEARLIDVKSIAFDERAFLKCRFGCKRWGRYWTCPPHLGISDEIFRKALDRYGKAILFVARDPSSGQEIGLRLEKEAMLLYGAYFAFALVLCVMCQECAYPKPCRYPHMARPSMDALGIDIPKTVEPLGLAVELDQKGGLLPKWYGMVLLE